MNASRVRKRPRSIDKNEEVKEEDKYFKKPRRSAGSFDETDDETESFPEFSESNRKFTQFFTVNSYLTVMEFIGKLLKDDNFTITWLEKDIELTARNDTVEFLVRALVTEHVESQEVMYCIDFIDMSWDKLAFEKIFKQIKEAAADENMVFEW